MTVCIYCCCACVYLCARLNIFNVNTMEREAKQSRVFYGYWFQSEHHRVSEHNTYIQLHTHTQAPILCFISSHNTVACAKLERRCSQRSTNEKREKIVFFFVFAQPIGNRNQLVDIRCIDIDRGTQENEFSSVWQWWVSEKWKNGYISLPMIQQPNKQDGQSIVTSTTQMMAVTCTTINNNSGGIWFVSLSTVSWAIGV